MAQARRISAVLTIGVSLIALTGTLGASGAQAATAPTPPPSSPKGLTAPVAQPAALDAVASYQPQVSCSPATLPGTAKLRSLALRTYGIGRDGGTSRGCAIGGQSEHKEGRSWDYMLDVNNPSEKKTAGQFIDFLTKNGGAQARRLGVMYVIYNKKIWSSYRMGWRDYNGAQSHTDHVHVSLSWAGARGLTSFWTGRVGAVDHGPCVVFSGQSAALRSSARTTPCPAVAATVKTNAYPTTYLGASGKNVKRAQKAIGTKRTGRFDARTWKALKKYQKANDLPKTGVLDAATWSSIKPTRVTFDAAKGMTRSSAAAYGRQHYGSMRLAPASAGKPVLLLQIALGMPVKQQTGFYGAKTKAAVAKAQSSAGQRRTGAADRSLWSALPRG
ncbi:peptidoglycan-binding domain-containing protein [Solicola sp. PLA-1-18]|uniref:peptidoglycan-binding domain-containing protein n=1 Tax=Solicola sp. PLA-1-18 TaxID=3380532 RepID=UPI003B7B7E2F